MDSFQLVLHTLPDFRHLHPAVQTEADNNMEALHAIIGTKHPQYFGIKVEPSVARLVDKGRFPILAAVAEKLKTDYSPSNIHFRPPSRANHHMVNTLIEEDLYLYPYNPNASPARESVGSNQS